MNRSDECGMTFLSTENEPADPETIAAFAHLLAEQEEMGRRITSIAFSEDFVTVYTASHAWLAEHPDELSVTPTVMTR